MLTQTSSSLFEGTVLDFKSLLLTPVDVITWKTVPDLPAMLTGSSTEYTAQSKSTSFSGYFSVKNKVVLYKEFYAASMCS
jgi:hypothetical protein